VCQLHQEIRLQVVRENLYWSREELADNWQCDTPNDQKSWDSFFEGTTHTCRGCGSKDFRDGIFFKGHLDIRCYSCGLKEGLKW
jgi:hypothetical protein